ncbi:PREDICTED: proteinaceous RNase P 2 [Nelumbo nucifera]|uniref:ribonuclease P n=2 Tax=Nelumbo nucifera TaxID=4432 RepID=A0A822YW01_NELNU|nr:PREDICTED: proteinaceous RNase P 2 [Nelumbo nucifera]DAD36862.1 TPA_asm: hypothetical protein HUJ06_007503 [Nelumbo nucifera]
MPLRFQNPAMEVANQTDNSTLKKNKKRKQSLESQFRFQLDTCSKNKDLSGALSLYQKAISENFHLNAYHFNTLLYLCSNCLSDPSSSLEPMPDSSEASALEYGFRIFDHMLASNINPTEATITAVARLAAARGDYDYAFELVKTMEKYKISPRLRSYDPALFAYCQRSDAEKAYSVEEHMISMGINPEQPELAALLKVSVEAGKEEKVYSYLHKLRSCVRFVNASTAEIIKRWFSSTLASEVGAVNWDVGRVKEVTSKNGGGWHGQGWLGKGNWVVCRSNIGSEGCCRSCSGQLACVDIDQSETEKFAESVASLAMERETKSNFRGFQEWLEKHATYEAIVDGANVGLYQQNFADGGFSLPQLDAVVKDLYERSQQKWPLVILHNKRYRVLAENPLNKKLLDEWKAHDALYTTPHGSNDDWYWLYAAVKLKCLLVTNDEMRDHIFELLGSNFFLKWKERHQVRYTFVKCNPRLQMPPSYSLVMQESEEGSWHVPIEGEKGECSDESSRTWLCITRFRSCECSDGGLTNSVVPKIYQTQDSNDQQNFKLCELKNIITVNGLQSDPTQFQLSDNKMTAITGKRKERSPSPEKNPNLTR